MEQLKAVPSVSPLEAEAFWTGGEDARAVMPGFKPETSSIKSSIEGADLVGIDLPGVGHIHHPNDVDLSLGTPSRAGESSPLRPEVESAADEVPLPQHLVGGVAADENREGLLTWLLFAAKDLAEAQIEPADETEPAFCTECTQDMLRADNAIGHEEACKTGRVLRILADLCNLATEPGQAVIEPAPVLALTNPAFGEPWLLAVQDGLLLIADRAGHEVYVGIESERELLRRIVACVNYCAAVPTRLVEDLTEGQAVQQ